MNGFNISNIQDAKLGTTQLSSIYLGSTKLWESDPQINEYLWFEHRDSGGYLYFELAGSMSDITIEYSTDKTNWTSVTLSTSGTTSTSIMINKGQPTYIRGNNSAYATSSSNYFHFRCPGYSVVGGNIMSLVYGDNFKGQTTLSSSYAFNSLFKSAGYLMSISNLRLPATSIPRYAYQNMFNNDKFTDMIPEIPATYVDYYGMSGMFSGCTSLDSVPDLSTVTRVNGYAFANMFSNCKSLTVLPDFHNVTQIDYWAPWRYTFSGCTSIVDARWNVNGTRLLPDHLTVSGGGSAYEQMFQGCTGLINAPELTEINPHAGEYNNMFNGCTNSSFLNIYTHATSLGTNYFADIVKNCGHTGTVYKAADVTWDSSQYSQFVYFGNSSSSSRWTVKTGSYNSGEYQT